MKKLGSKAAQRHKKSARTIGQARFEKISAVEGIVLTEAMRKRAAGFERDGLDPAERRQAIIRAHRKG